MKNLLRPVIRLAFGQSLLSIKSEAGFRFRFRPAEYPRLFMGFGRFETSKRKEWTVLLRPGEVILDVGANIGLTAHRFYALLQGQCEMWLFEPLPRNLQLLRLNCEPIQERTKIVEAAVGRESSEVSFRDNLEHGALSRLASLETGKPSNEPLWSQANTVVVKQISLDDFMRSHPEVAPTFIKMDVEGAAGLVVLGAKELLDRFKPMIDCSFHGREELDGVCSELLRLGYRGLSVADDGSCTWIEIRRASLFLHPKSPRVSALKFTQSNPGAVEPEKSGVGR